MTDEEDKKFIDKLKTLFQMMNNGDRIKITFGRRIHHKFEATRFKRYDSQEDFLELAHKIILKRKPKEEDYIEILYYYGDDSIEDLSEDWFFDPAYIPYKIMEKEDSELDGQEILKAIDLLIMKAV